MAKLGKADYKLKKDEAPSLLDQALQDEFCHVIASIAVRLTRDNNHGKNGDDSIKREVN